MSKARTCDNCGETIVVDDRGDDVNGEISVWLTVGTLDGALKQDACSRSCAIELLGDESDLTGAIEERMEGVAAVVRMLNGEDADDED